MSKPAFNPDQPFEAVTTKPAFDPNKPFEAADTMGPQETLKTMGPADHENETPGLLDRAQALERGLVRPGQELFSDQALQEKKKALETAANTVIGGYLPQVYGALKSGPGILQEGSEGQKEYLKSRDEMDSELKNTGGGTKAIGTAVGLIPGLVTGGAAPELTATVPRAATTAGLLGAAQNPGDEPGKIDPIQAKERAKSGLVNAAIGGVVAKGAQALEGASEGLKSTANLRALKQSGAMLRDLRSLDNTGRLERAGQLLLDEGIVTKGATLDSIEQKTHDALNRYGNQILGVENGIDAHVPNMIKNGQGEILPNRMKMADRIERDVIEPLKGSSATEKLIPQVQDYADSLRAKGNTPLTFAEARKEKLGFDKILNWDKTQSPSLELTKQVRGAINKEIEDSVRRLSDSTKDPIYEAWKNAKDKFGTLQKVNDIAQDKQFREMANRYISPSDYGMGLGTLMAAAAGKGHLGPAEVMRAIGAGTANHLIRKHGNAVVSSTANQISKALDNGTGQAVGGLLRQAIIPGVEINR